MFYVSFAFSMQIKMEGFVWYISMNEVNVKKKWHSTRVTGTSLWKGNEW